MWRKMKEQVANAGHAPSDPVALEVVEFSYDTKNSITTAVPIHPGALACAREAKPLGMVSGLTGKRFEKPLNVLSMFL